MSVCVCVCVSVCGTRECKLGHPAHFTQYSLTACPFLRPLLIVLKRMPKIRSICRHLQHATCRARAVRTHRATPHYATYMGGIYHMARSQRSHVDRPTLQTGRYTIRSHPARDRPDLVELGLRLALLRLQRHFAGLAALRAFRAPHRLCRASRRGRRHHADEAR